MLIYFQKISYTDLQVNQLLDITTGKLFCPFCQTEVKEDESATPKTDSRTQLAKFNMQIAPLYDLLKVKLEWLRFLRSRKERIFEKK